MPLALHNLSILIVEDTLPMQKLLVSVIESLGFQKPMVARDGAEGFALFKKHNPDIVISDWLMQPEDGLELTRKIRTHGSSPNKMTPVILVTGYSSLTRVQEARDAGVTEFLVKPFTANDVAKRISYVVNHPRDFISMREFFGPDRRRRRGDDYLGPKRRKEERGKDKDDTWTITF